MTDSPGSNNEVTCLSAAHQQQDHARIGAILAEHRAYLCRVVQARLTPLLGRRVDASDIVQEAQIEALRQMDDFLQNPQVPVKIWLRKLVVQRLIMAERKHLGAARRAVGKERQSARTSLDVAQQFVARLPSPSQAARRRETAEAMRRSLDQLAHIDREIILMHLYEGLTSQESAAALGIEPAAARKRLGRAIQRLRRVLEEQDLGASSL